jgi:hypothetical protein
MKLDRIYHLLCASCSLTERSTKTVTRNNEPLLVASGVNLEVNTEKAMGHTEK